MNTERMKLLKIFLDLYTERHGKLDEVNFDRNTTASLYYAADGRLCLPCLLLQFGKFNNYKAAFRNNYIQITKKD